jgi:hypothetical protein
VTTVKDNSKTGAEESRLSKQYIRILLIISTKFVNLCATVTGKIDPEAAAMLAYVRDDIVAGSKPEFH